MLADTWFYQFQQLDVPIPWLDFLQNVKNILISMSAPSLAILAKNWLKWLKMAENEENLHI